MPVIPNLFAEVPGQHDHIGGQSHGHQWPHRHHAHAPYKALDSNRICVSEPEVYVTNDERKAALKAVHVRCWRRGAEDHAELRRGRVSTNSYEFIVMAPAFYLAILFKTQDNEPYPTSKHNGKVLVINGPISGGRHISRPPSCRMAAGFGSSQAPLTFALALACCAST
jgi:hypothetical protein